MTPVICISPDLTFTPPQSDPDLVLDLVLETVTAGHGVLVFCPTKAWCEQLALNVAAEFCRLGQLGTAAGAGGLS